MLTADELANTIKSLRAELSPSQEDISTPAKQFEQFSEEKKEQGKL